MSEPGDPAMAAAPFVGREGEIARLAFLMERATQGSGAVALVTGEAGIGKTTLAGEFLRRARERDPSMVLCRGRCIEQYGPSEAYLPFLDALGTLLLGHGREPTAALLRAYAPTWCLQLPAIAASPVSRDGLESQTIGATKQRMLREMGDLFEAAAADSLVVGLLEDIQWADPATSDVVRHLSNRIARQRILLIGTFRPGDLQAAGHPLQAFVADLRNHALCHELRLGPLEAEHVTALLDSRFVPHTFPPELARLLHDRTQGHPFFLTTLVQLLLDGGDIVRAADGWRLARPLLEKSFAVPDSVRALVRRRLEPLSDADRLALQYASVMGTEFLSASLAGVLGVDEVALQERLARLDDVYRLIDTRGEEDVPGGGLTTRYRFSQVIYQEAIYSDIVSKRRVQMHREVAAQLLALYGHDSPRMAASLALHFERGRDFGSAIVHLCQAADNAARLNARDEAADLLGRALSYVEKVPPEERRGRALAVHERRGAVYVDASRFSEAAACYRAMLDLAREAGSTTHECAALSGLCSALFFSQRFEEMAVHAAQALEAADREARPSLRIEAMLLAGQILQHDGKLEDSIALLEEIQPLAEAIGHRRALLNAIAYRGVIHYWQSEYAQAEERLVEALPLARELRDGLAVLICIQFLGLAWGNRGRISRALAALTEGMDMGRRNGDRFWLPHLAAHIGWVHREVEDFQGAIGHDHRGLAIAVELGVPQAEASALLNLSLDYTRAGILAEAEAILDRLERQGRALNWFDWLFELRLESAIAEYWLGRGELDKAAEHAEQLISLAGPKRAHTYLVTAHRVLIRAAVGRGDHSRASAHARAGLAEIEACPTPLSAWRLHSAIGFLRQAEGNADAAREAYHQALTVVHGIASGIDDGALRETFLESPAVRHLSMAQANP